MFQRPGAIATFRSLSILIALNTLLLIPGWAQTFKKLDRDLVQAMLGDADADVRKYYYDSKLRGVDWDTKVRNARENIDKAESQDGAVSEVAALLDSLNDSHTNFSVPPRTYKLDYGFRTKMIGDHCYVVSVGTDTDAEKKGLRLGDEIVSIGNYPITRTTLWRIRYIYGELRPQSGLHLTLRGERAETHEMDVIAKSQPSSVLKYNLNLGVNEKVRDRDDAYGVLMPQFFEKGDGLVVVRIPAFAMSATDVDFVVGKMRKHQGAVLDLRGNPGGFVSTIDRILGAMFENDFKILDRVGRKSTTALFVSGRHRDAFTGRLAVLIDSDSSSASEIFARVIQLQKRGFVLGDRSSGMVMESRFFHHETAEVSYGTSVTVADLIMTDGKSLEHVGVEPDILLLPTPADLAARRDPVLAKAATLVGTRLTPEEAGLAFKESKPLDSRP